MSERRLLFKLHGSRDGSVSTGGSVSISENCRPVFRKSGNAAIVSPAPRKRAPEWLLPACNQAQERLAGSKVWLLCAGCCSQKSHPRPPERLSPNWRTRWWRATLCRTRPEPASATCTIFASWIAVRISMVTRGQRRTSRFGVPRAGGSSESRSVLAPRAGEPAMLQNATAPPLYRIACSPETEVLRQGCRKTPPTALFPTVLDGS